MNCAPRSGRPPASALRGARGRVRAVLTLAAGIAAVTTACTASRGAPLPGAPTVPRGAACAGPLDALPPMASGVPVRVFSTAHAAPPDAAHAAPPRAVARTVLEQAYETLVRVDCDNQVVGALATAWTFDSTQGAWRFRLRDGATFWGGGDVLADDVVRAWRDAPDARARALAAGAMVVTPRMLLVRGDTGMPRVIAATPYTVARRRAGSAWPEGTGAYAVRDSAGEPLALFPRTGALHGAFTFATIPLGAARDVVDRGVDALVTGDRAVIAYASGIEGVRSTPLDWDRTYALLIPTRDDRANAERSALSASLRASLARDVVRDDARAAERPAWTVGSPPCSGTPGDTPTNARVAFDADDAVARALAERVVALASAGAASARGADSIPAVLQRAGASLTVLPLEGRAFANAIEGGRELAYVVAMPYRAGRTCAHAAVVAMIDTREHLIVRGAPPPSRGRAP